jgi:hypothetical protein
MAVAAPPFITLAMPIDKIEEAGEETRAARRVRMAAQAAVQAQMQAAVDVAVQSAINQMLQNPAEHPQLLQVMNNQVVAHQLLNQFAPPP